MAKTTLALIALLLVLAGMLGYNFVARPFVREEQLQTNPAVASPTSLSSSPQPNPTSLLTELTPSQIVGQLMMVPITLSSSGLVAGEEVVSTLAAVQPSAVVLFGSQLPRTTVAEVIAQLDEWSTLPLWVGVDHEGGEVQRLSGEGFTILPSASVACQLAVTQRREVFDQSGQELAEVGVDVVLAPVIDLASGNSVLKSRTCSSDPGQVSQYAQDYVAAFVGHGILPTLKHFPGIGSISKDLHTTFDQIKIDNLATGVYVSVLDQFPDLMVMTSHVGIKDQQPDKPCSLAAACVGEIQRNYPETLIITDALEMAATQGTATGSAQLSLAERSVRAVEAGNHLLLFGEGVSAEQLRSVHQTLLDHYLTEPLFQSLVDTAAEQIIERKRE